MTFTDATRRYERWLSRQIPLIPSDLELKHSRMREGCFAFFRASFYRWAQQFPEICPGEWSSPRVLAAGDLHVENFGTWRDIEGRLVWGIDDFDEACRLPYLADVIRLLTSAALAAAENRLALSPATSLQAFRAGYLEQLHAGPGSIVLAEQHQSLGIMARARLKDPAKFWNELTGLPSIIGAIPRQVNRGIEALLPGRAVDSLRFVHRVAGLGSLGRRRYVAIGSWRGGLIAREAKELALSACVWAGVAKGSRTYYQDAIERSNPSTDPFLRSTGRWVVRRLAPDCSRIELASLGEERDELRLLNNMGRETANLHLATGKRKRLLSDFETRTAPALLQAVTRMSAATRQDWKEWKRSVS